MLLIIVSLPPTPPEEGSNNATALLCFITRRNMGGRDISTRWGEERSDDGVGDPVPALVPVLVPSIGT